MGNVMPKTGLPGIHMPHLQYPIPAPHNIHNMYVQQQQQQQQQSIYNAPQQQQQQQQGVIAAPVSLQNTGERRKGDRA
jgi:hypothetical protein